jgi:uncharacterized protein (TIGR02594 family)
MALRPYLSAFAGLAWAATAIIQGANSSAHMATTNNGSHLTSDQLSLPQPNDVMVYPSIAMAPGPVPETVAVLPLRITQKIPLECHVHATYDACRKKPAVVGHRHRKPVARTAAASTKDTVSAVAYHVYQVAMQYDGLDEHRDVEELTSLFARTIAVDLDPRRTAWCGAFLNSVLIEAGVPGTADQSAAGFRHYGRAVSRPMLGDIVITRGFNRRHQEHVALYVGQARINGRLYYQLLGGNQHSAVSISNIPAASVQTIRRYG